MNRAGVVVTCALALASCGMFSDGRPRPIDTPPATVPSMSTAGSGGSPSPLPSVPPGTGAGSGTRGAGAGSGAVSPAVPAPPAGGPGSVAGGAHEPIGLDSLPDATIPQGDQIGVLEYAILAAADPYGVAISVAERACLSAVVDLSDEQVDAALEWDEVDGTFAEPVNGCLTEATRQAFAVWHHVDQQLADADDHQYRCVEQHLAAGATQDNLEAALVACGVRGVGVAGG